MSTETDIAYLAGFIDGEGCFSIYAKNNRKKNRTTVALNCTIAITNCDPDQVLAICEIYDRMGLHARLVQRKAAKHGYRDPYQIEMSRMSQQKVLIEAVLPYLKGKQAEAQLMLRFINSRMERNGKQYHVFNDYNDEEISLFEQLRALKGHHPSKHSSEAIRQTADTWVARRRQSIRDCSGTPPQALLK